MSRYQDTVDLGLNLNRQAWQTLHAVSGEPDFAPYDKERGAYKVETTTAAWYNCRERGFSIAFAHPLESGRRERLYVCFAEHRCSDQIVVYAWETDAPLLNPPTPADVPDRTWQEPAMFRTPQAAALYIRNRAKAFLGRAPAVNDNAAATDGGAT